MKNRLYNFFYLVFPWVLNWTEVREDETEIVTLNERPHAFDA